MPKPSRQRILESLPAILRWGCEIRERTNEILRLGWAPKNYEVITLMLGNRALNHLRLINAMRRQSIDDSIGVVARALVEATLDLRYLHVDTERVVDSKPGKRAQRHGIACARYPLSIDCKCRLFHDYKLIKRNIIGSSFPLNRRHELLESLAWRKERGIVSRATWHGSTQEALLHEMKPAISGLEYDRLESLLEQYKQFSYISHTNPTEQFYFEWKSCDFGPRIQLTPGVEFPELIAISILASIQVFVEWQTDISPCTMWDDVKSRGIEHLQRLPPWR